MKRLVYTVSDFTPGCVEAIKLLHSSLLTKNKADTFDFAVIGTAKPPEGFPFRVYLAPFDGITYAGWLKYSIAVPQGYDRYIYMDSDILFYDNLDLFNGSDLVLLEEELKMNSPWHCFDYEVGMENQNGICAGLFSYSKDCTIIAEMQELLSQLPNPVGIAQIDQARLEQQCFNYVVWVVFVGEYANISPIVQMGVGKHATDGKTIFHFCGFTGSMEGKAQKMKNFDEMHGWEFI